MEFLLSAPTFFCKTPLTYLLVILVAKHYIVYFGGLPGMRYEPCLGERRMAKLLICVFIFYKLSGVSTGTSRVRIAKQSLGHRPSKSQGNKKCPYGQFFGGLPGIRTRDPLIKRLTHQLLLTI